MTATIPATPARRSLVPAPGSVASRPASASGPRRWGGHLLRYGLVLILLWIGGMKFTAYEAEGIRPFVENSPPFAWTYPAFGVRGSSNLLGATEVAVGLLIAARPWFPRLSAVGSLLASGCS